MGFASYTCVRCAVEARRREALLHAIAITGLGRLGCAGVRRAAALLSHKGISGQQEAGIRHRLWREGKDYKTHILSNQINSCRWNFLCDQRCM